VEAFFRAKFAENAIVRVSISVQNGGFSGILAEKISVSASFFFILCFFIAAFLIVLNFFFESFFFFFFF
jgi:hypothetical protein